MVPTSKCAFVNFSSRDSAETAAQRCSVKVVISGKEVRVGWGRSRPGRKGKGRDNDADGAGSSSTANAQLES